MPSEPSVAAPIPEPPPSRKRPRRLFLYLPFILLALLAAGYGGFWFVVTSKVERAVDARAEALRQAGYVVELDGRRVEGFPFRIKIRQTEARIASPSGWAVSAPGLEAEAYLHDPGHWVLVAPQGLVVNRPEGGGLTVKGEALRGSVAGTDKAPWRIVLQGRKLTVAPAAGARPFSLASADLLELYLRPTPDGKEGMALIRLEGGKAGDGSVLEAVAGDEAVTGSLQARLSRPAAFRGADWGDAVRAWAAAGGAAEEVQGSLIAGKSEAKVENGTLGVGADGRLVGALPMTLKQPAPAITALAGGAALDEGAVNSAAAVAAARAQGETARINLVFQAGATTLGPVRIGPSPRVVK